MSLRRASFALNGVSFVCLLAVIAALVALGSAAPARAQDAPAAWTILHYSAADNDLEPFMIGDLVEMQAVGSTADVNIVVQMDRAEAFDQVNGDWTDARRFLIAQAREGASSGDFAISPGAFIDNLRSLDLSELGISESELEAEIDGLLALSPEEFDQFYMGTFAAPPPGGVPLPALQQTALEMLGEVNMGDPQTLVDFALWGIEQYPAERYALVISNHGGGWFGVAFDEASANDMLTMPELDAALAQITAESGIGKFDLIGFDACLMAQVEVLKVLQPHTDYAIISQETIPGAGWEYVTPLLALTTQPDLSMAALGQSVVDSYMRYYTEDLAGYDAFDLHLFDLSQLDVLEGALDAFAEAVLADLDASLTAIGKARNNAQIFAANDPSEADAYSSVDLVDFMRLLAQLTPDAAVQAAAEDVIAATDAVVVYGQASPGLPGSNGVAIFFPRNAGTFSDVGGAEKYLRETDMQTWTGFLNTFHGTAVETFVPDDLRIAIRDVLPADAVASIWDPPVVIFETEGSGIVDLQFFASLQLEDGSEIILDQSPLEFFVITPDGDEINEFPEGLSTNEFAWNVEMPLLTDGQNSVEALVIVEDDAAIVEGVYITASGDETDAYLVFDLETRTFQSAWGVQEGEDGQATGEIRPARGDSFEPYWQYLNEAGEIEYDYSGTRLVFGATPITYSFVPADSGTYTLAMWVEDMAGNISYDEVEFTVDNADLDEAYRGFKDVQAGVNFLYPWTWDDPTVIEDEEGGYTLSVTDETGDASILVDAYESEGIDDLIELSGDILDEIGAAYSDFEIFPLEESDGTLIGDAASVAYEYADDEVGPRFGVQLLIYSPDNQAGYIIDIDVPAADSDLAYELYDIIAGSILFFPPYDAGE